MRVGVPPSLLPSNFLTGLGADHSPSCSKRRLAARRPEVAMTTKLLSRPEPPVPLRRCPGNLGPSVLHKGEVSSWLLELGG